MHAVNGIMCFENDRNDQSTNGQYSNRSRVNYDNHPDNSYPQADAHIVDHNPSYTHDPSAPTAKAIGVEQPYWMNN